MEKSVQDILEDLSYSFATPEAQELHRLIFDKKFAKAKKMLLEYISEVDAKRVIDYFHEKNTRKIQLVEITVKDIVLGNEKQQYLFKIGDQLAQSSVFKLHHDSPDYSIYMSGQMFSLKQVNQVWKIV
jgi:hypothetical protein